MEDQRINFKSYSNPYSEDWMQVLRNQLNIISTSVFLLETDVTETNKLDRLRYLQKIKEAMERINIIVK
ncbi:MAG: hypothetical protein KAR38_08180 [Calditrichia bacterium]|nr:hypothetical protein [Calditrichia bacterium]